MLIKNICSKCNKTIEINKEKYNFTKCYLLCEKCKSKGE